MRGSLHHFTIGDASSIEHGLEFLSAAARSTEWALRTWAPGKSWPFVMVEDHLFSTGDPSRRVPCSTEGKLTYLGISVPLTVLEDSILLFSDYGFEFQDGRWNLKFEGRI